MIGIPGPAGRRLPSRIRIWRTFYASDFAPLADGYIHLSVYDSAAQQGMALVTKLGDTSDYAQTYAMAAPPSREKSMVGNLTLILV